MSIKKVRQVKEDKGFKLWDLVIYGIIALAVAALFLCLFLTRDKSPFTGVAAYYGGELCFTYTFENDKLTVAENCTHIEVEEESSAGLTIIFRADGSNKIYINKEKRTVRVTEADCSLRRDCVYTPEIKDNTGIIYCSPHKLKIVPLNFEQLDEIPKL